jgi:hypothetical protein
MENQSNKFKNEKRWFSFETLIRLTGTTIGALFGTSLNPGFGTFCGALLGRNFTIYLFNFQE